MFLVRLPGCFCGGTACATGTASRQLKLTTLSIYGARFSSRVCQRPARDAMHLMIAKCRECTPERRPSNDRQRFHRLALRPANVLTRIRRASMFARSRWWPTSNAHHLTPSGQPAHDGGLLLVDRLGDWVHVHVEHRRLGLPFQLPGRHRSSPTTSVPRRQLYALLGSHFPFQLVFHRGCSIILVGLGLVLTVSPCPVVHTCVCVCVWRVHPRGCWEEWSHTPRLVLIIRSCSGKDGDAVAQADRVAG